MATRRVEISQADRDRHNSGIFNSDGTIYRPTEEAALALLQIAILRGIRGTITLEDLVNETPVDHTPPRRSRRRGF